MSQDEETDPVVQHIEQSECPPWSRGELMADLLKPKRWRLEYA